MKKFNSSQKGSIMIEALAMLGLIAMVTPVLYRKAAERTTELQDINVASQIRMVSQAVDSYLKDNYTNLASMGDTTVIDPESEHFAKIQAYLPEGFDLNQASKLFEDFRIAVKKESLTDLQGNHHNVFTSAVVAALNDDMTRGRAAKIATMIGTNGGMITKDESGYRFNGTQGSWSTTPEQFGFAWDDEHPVKDNSLVSISTEAISSAVGDVDSSEALYRVWTGEADKNTMKTPLLFGNNSLLNMQGHDIQGVTNIVANSAAGVTVTSGLTTPNANITTLLTAAAANINGALSVTGTSTLNGITNTGTITSTGDITAPQFHGTLQGDSYGHHHGDTTGTHHGDVDGGSISGTSLAITGDGSISGNATVGGTLDVTGTASFHNDLGVGGRIKADSLRVTNDASIGRNLVVDGETTLHKTTIDGDLDMNGHDIIDVNKINGKLANFNNLHARYGLTVGGDDPASGTMLEVSGDGTVVKGDFGVGAGVAATGNKIVANNDVTYIGRGYSQSAPGLVMDNDTARLSAGTDKQSWIGLQDNDINIGIADNEHGDPNIHIRDGRIILQNKGAEGGAVIDGGGLTIGNTNAARVNPSEYTDFSQPQLGSVDEESPNVLISRNGVIELAAPNNKDDGFIRARRLVSDKPYALQGVVGNQAGGAIKGDGSNSDESYDYYQINPAYTSVMNDIKLASRGGSRLSDILPDYINKGIYVADNTVSNLDFDWTLNDDDDGAPKFLHEGIGNISDCGNDANCITSPWLGFVPAPQCPPAYDTVITIEPFRWKMSEIYDVRNLVGVNNVSTLKKIFPIHGTGKSTSAGAESFDYMVDRFENPLRENDYSDEYEVTMTNEGNTATVTGAPLLFQTNTWLNTSMAEHSNDGKVKGWSVLMGFLYPMTNAGNDSPYAQNNYKAFYDKIKESSDVNVDASSVIWNLFPVRNQEMAAIVRLYCSFNRLDEGGNWIWSNPEVYKYDQLNSLGTTSTENLNFWNKNMYEKDDAWQKAVNDPELGYDDAW